MTTQLERLQENLKDLEPEFGPDNPFVLGLKAQIARLTKPRAENPMAGTDRYSVGVRAAPTSVKPKASK